LFPSFLIIRQMSFEFEYLAEFKYISKNNLKICIGLLLMKKTKIKIFRRRVSKCTSMLITD
jgi:hypothetical protein